MTNIENTFVRLADLVKNQATGHGFMGLLNDKGYVPMSSIGVPTPSNDNDIIWQVA